ncbi:MAG: UDP-N-acetylglucosamine 1-carboxyvinyltransferase [Lachnospiraceae bacterium]|nr:UDP-N-acetylglucosamine 1-carboxyvinyltransferase [Candidatus Darwinimomas equi]
MSQFIMKGGQPLIGEVNISGAKNAALGIIAGAILTDDDVNIENIPDVRDINIMLEALKELGAHVERVDRNSVKINAGSIRNAAIDDDYLRMMRASYYFIGALLGRIHEAQVPLPGGCVIGSRPIDQHIKGFRALGAKVNIENGNVVTKADRLIGDEIYLDKVSVGATINIMMAAALAEGRAVIGNAAKEPHIVDMANFLNSMGANIRGAGTDVIRITGVSKLHGTDYSIIPDQIEAGTFMVAAAITNGDVTVRNIIPKHMESVSAKLEEVGCMIMEYDDSIRVIGTDSIRPANIMTLPYPGFPTDMQPQITTLLALSQGTSMVVESIFDSRFKYVEELLRMGADIRVEGNVAVVNGVKNFSPAQITAPDLRAGAALVLAGLATDGITVVDEIEFIQRGYEHFEQKLTELGAAIEIVDSERDAKKFTMKVG